ncbi:MAG: lipid-A-disaccharide synthase N-terminal domain-containing protein [Pseudomonadota bacterium]
MIPQWLPDPWKILGFSAQGLFMSRFLIQWIASERAGHSHVPRSFWYFSLAGGLLLFIYAVHIWDPVFVLGQGCGLLVYARNLMLPGKKTRSHPAA